MDDATAPIAAFYRRWGASEARGRSDLYERTCELIAGNDALLGFLAGLPVPKRQPNLFFGAVQYLFGPPTTPEHFRDLVLDHRDRLAATMRERTTQTNQPARCATLLPALARIDGPLALLEVGASAGLCLLPDRYDYLYTDAPGTTPDRSRGTTEVSRAERGGPPAPRFVCAVDPATPRPRRPVEVVWRAGLDLNPLDVTDPDARAWLDALIWPGEEHLRTDLHRALDIAATNPPRVERGDLRRDLRQLADEAPADATLVVFHTAVLAYVPDAADRDGLAAAIAELAARRPVVWLANETPARIPGLPDDVVAGHPLDRFLLCRDGEPLARTDPHGAGLTWLAPR